MFTSGQTYGNIFQRQEDRICNMVLLGAKTLAGFQQNRKLPIVRGKDKIICILIYIQCTCVYCSLMLYMQ